MNKIDQIIEILLRIEEGLGAKHRTKNQPPPPSPDYDEFLVRYNTIFKSKRRGTEQTRRQFNARIAEGYDVDIMVGAMIEARKEQRHIDSGFKWLTPEFFTRSEKLELYGGKIQAEKKSYQTYDDIKEEQNR